WWQRPVRQKRAGRRGCSCKQPVDIPARIRLFLIESVAEQPVAAAAVVLNSVIVARQPLIVAAAPPFRGNALGPFVAANRMQCAAPAKTLWRAVWHLGDHFDRLRGVEEPEGTQRRFAGGGLGPGFRRRRVD